MAAAVKLVAPVSELGKAKAKRDGIRGEIAEVHRKRDQLLGSREALATADDALKAFGAEQASAIEAWLRGHDIADRPRTDPAEHQRLIAAAADAKCVDDLANASVLAVKDRLAELAKELATVVGEVETAAALVFSNTILADKIEKYAKLRAEADAAAGELRAVVDQFSRPEPDPHAPPHDSRFEFLASRARNALNAPIRIAQADYISPLTVSRSILAELRALQE